MERLEEGPLTLEVDSGADEVVVHWRGRSSGREPWQTLKPWFTQLLAELNGRALSMHFNELEHFNSSTIGALVQILNLARKQGTPVRVHYDASLRWQALSFEALKRGIRPFQQGTPVEFVDTSGR